MEVIENLMKNIKNLIQLGWRSRLIKIGYDDTLKELKKGVKGFLILAEDLSKRTKRNILYKYKGDFYEIFTKKEIGKMLGKEEVGIIFVPENKYGLKLKGLIEKYLILDNRRYSSCQK